MEWGEDVISPLSVFKSQMNNVKVGKANSKKTTCSNFKHTIPVFVREIKRNEIEMKMKHEIEALQSSKVMKWEWALVSPFFLGSLLHLIRIK